MHACAFRLCHKLADFYEIQYKSYLIHEGHSVVLLICFYSNSNHKPPDKGAPPPYHHIFKTKTMFP